MLPELPMTLIQIEGFARARFHDDVALAIDYKWR